MKVWIIACYFGSSAFSVYFYPNNMPPDFTLQETQTAESTCADLGFNTSSNVFKTAENHSLACYLFDASRTARQRHWLSPARWQGFFDVQCANLPDGAAVRLRSRRREK